MAVILKLIMSRQSTQYSHRNNVEKEPIWRTYATWSCGYNFQKIVFDLKVDIQIIGAA